MQFNSILFLFAFFPLFLAVYYILPKVWRNGLLVLGSFFFYYFASANKVLVLGLLLGFVLFTYIIAQLLRQPGRGGILTLALTVMAATLIFLKCYRGGRFLPAGLSFYLFQLAAYLIDVYRRQIRPDNSIMRFAAQTVMFPKLLMGPLMDPKDLQVQTRRPDYSFDNFHQGLQELVVGLALKVLLADRVGGLWAQAGTIGYESISTPFAWMALTAYAMRLFFDFWGYSIMARGLGHMLGFHIPENFLDPYASRSVSEFWRRWHASLGAWFRNYIYIPLGGNRKGALRTFFNLMVVWAFTGLWHGVGGNYMLWAGILFCFILLERIGLRRVLKYTGPLSNLYTVGVILLSWVPFAIGDWNEMLMFFGRLFGTKGQTLNPQDYIIIGKQYAWLLLAGVICATPLPRAICRKVKEHPLADVIVFVLFWIVVYFIATSSQDPFMYFQY